MFTLPGLIALLVAHCTKVHEMSTLLRALPVMPTLYLLATGGFLLDLRLGVLHAEACPQVRLVLPLWLWTLVSAGMNGGFGMVTREINLTLSYMLIFLLVAHSLQSFRALRIMAMFLLTLTLFLGIVAFIQAFSPFQCILLAANDIPDFRTRSDGRACETPADCRVNAEPGEEYICERPGPLGTTTIGEGRVRYRGILEDPNELALALAIVLPFAMAALSQRRSLVRLLIVAFAFAIVLPVVIWTQSRTGQIAFVVVVAAFLLNKISWKGLLMVAVLAAPALMLGGRSGESADESSLERLEAWVTGINMLKSSPLWGIGKGQFSEYYYITAHNTFVLEAAELGLIGMILWVSVLYTAFKIVILAIRRYRDRADARVPYIWARALRASLCGIVVGTNFLSLGYHPLIWTYFALPGAFYLATRRHDPEFRIVFGMRDLLSVSGFSIVWLIGVKIYLMSKGL